MAGVLDTGPGYDAGLPSSLLCPLATNRPRGEGPCSWPQSKAVTGLDEGPGPWMISCAPGHLHTSVSALLRPLSRASQPGERTEMRVRWNGTQLLPVAQQCSRCPQTGPRRTLWTHPLQTGPEHTPEVSRSFLSTRSERRHSSPWAPATPRSSSLVGMGSSESHCSTSQLQAQKSSLRSREAPQMSQDPRVPLITPTVSSQGSRQRARVGWGRVGWLVFLVEAAPADRLAWTMPVSDSPGC